MEDLRCDGWNVPSSRDPSRLQVSDEVCCFERLGYGYVETEEEVLFAVFEEIPDVFDELAATELALESGGDFVVFAPHIAREVNSFHEVRRRVRY